MFIIWDLISHSELSSCDKRGGHFCNLWVLIRIWLLVFKWSSWIKQNAEGSISLPFRMQYSLWKEFWGSQAVSLLSSSMGWGTWHPLKAEPWLELTAFIQFIVTPWTKSKICHNYYWFWWCSIRKEVQIESYVLLYLQLLLSIFPQLALWALWRFTYTVHLFSKSTKLVFCPSRQKTPWLVIYL